MIKKMLKRKIGAIRKGEKGSALILVLIFMAVASLVVPAMLNYTQTGFRMSTVYEENTRKLYAAESGINDGLWYAQYESFFDLFGPAYKEYDFHSSWNYDLDEPINGYDVSVDVENVWIPSNLTAPTELQAEGIINSGKLVVTGSSQDVGTYRIRISFYPDETNDPKVETLGVWLPPGFEYVEGSSNLEQSPGEPYYPASVTVSPHASGEAVVWSFFSVPLDEFGPDVDTIGASTIAAITFDYTSTEQEQKPNAVSWVTTSDAPDVPFSWDADTKIYRLTATADDVSVESYASQSELRDLDDAMNGDYFAIGNTLMTTTGDIKVRDRLYRESSATVDADDIPALANIQAAWLYWSGWIDEPHEVEIFSDSVSDDETWTTIFEDDCSELGLWQTLWQDDASSLGDWQTLWAEDGSDFSDWQNGNVWSISSGSFLGRDSNADEGDTPEDEPQSALTLNSSVVDLSSYGSGDVKVEWQQWEWGGLESSDILYYQFYGNGGWGSLNEAFRNDIGSTPQDMSVTIPDAYLTSDFRMRFFITAFRGSNEYCYIDDIVISARQAGGWSAGDDWEVYNNQFRGHHDGSENDRYLTLNESIDLSAYSSDSVRISWEQDEDGYLEGSDALQYSISNDDGSTWSGLMTAFSNDNPDSPFIYDIPNDYLTDGFRIRFYLASFSGNGEYAYIDDLEISVQQAGGWSAGDDWEVYNNQFRGHHDGSENDRYLTLNESIDLSAYSSDSVRISWEQDEDGYLEGSDALQYSISNDDGDTWSSLMTAFSNDNPDSPFIYDIPNDYLTDGFRIRFYLASFSGNGEYAYIDDILIEVKEEGSWILGDDWDIYNGDFRGHHYGGNDEEDRYLTMNQSVDLSAYQGTQVVISWDQDEDGNLNSQDSLQFSFSANDGITWGGMQTAFSDDNPDSPFSYVVPDGYLTSGFRVRYYIEGFTAEGYGNTEYAYIDNITIKQVDFGVNKVVFNGTEITADKQQFDENTGGFGGGVTYSYSCFYDATDLVNTMIDNEELETNGAGTYTIGHVLREREGDPGYSYDLYPSGTTGYPLGIPDAGYPWSEWSYAGWSLILIYTSPETEGHQMYLYDTFTYVGSGDTLSLPITGFLAPSDPTGSRLTCFIAEGDPFYVGDWVTLNGNYLTDAVNPTNNPWNSYSNALDNPSITGVDLDTFDISSFVQAGDTSAEFATGTPIDIYNVIYIILSFRHDATFGGTISYLIR